MNTKKRQVTVIQVSRVLIQILFFILLPGLYAATFDEIKQVYLAILSHEFRLSAMLPQLVGIIALIPFTALLGRFFCGWMCAFGSMGDFLYFLGSKTRKKAIAVPETLDKIGKSIKYGLLVALLFYFWREGTVDFTKANPWNAFGVLATVTKVPDFSYALQQFFIGVILLLLIMVASFFIERFFCRYLCPMGAIFSITARVRLFKLKKPSKNCGNCRICTRNCSMGIALYKSDKVSSGECINCMKCVSACPRKNVKATITGQDIQPILVGTFAVAAMSGTYYPTAYAADRLASDTSVQLDASSMTVSESSTMQQKYADGTYEGSGIGFRGATTKVAVTIEKGMITGVETISFGDDAPYYNRAYANIVSQVLSSQSTEVDAVSGATYSSNGIMGAVADALNQAETGNSGF